jgi:hypothetical protein
VSHDLDLLRWPSGPDQEGDDFLDHDGIPVLGAPSGRAQKITQGQHRVIDAKGEHSLRSVIGVLGSCAPLKLDRPIGTRSDQEQVDRWQRSTLIRAKVNVVKPHTVS